MAIDYKEEVAEKADIEELMTRNVKFSDWLENQLLDRFGCGHYRQPNGQMCGAGMFADFLGFDWSKYSESCPEIYDLLVKNYPKVDCDLNGLNVEFLDESKFDKLYLIAGPQTAKNYAVIWFRERGL